MTSITNDYNNGSSCLKLAENYPYSYKVINRSLKECGVEMRDNSYYQSKYTLNETYFHNIDNESKAYWLGFIYADGFISEGQYGRPSIGISISKTDEDHLVKFKDDIESTYKINSYKVTGGYKIGIEYVRILMKAEIMVSKLKEYGIDTNKSFTCRFPEKGVIPDSLLRHFIRGYFDGNGSLTFYLSKAKNGLHEFTVKINGTKDMVSNIQKYFGFDKQFKLTERHPERNNNNYSLDIGGRHQVKKVLDYLYKDSNIYLERKYKRYIMFNNEYKYLYKVI